MPRLQRLPSGFVAATGVVVVGRRRRSLSRGGAIAALPVGAAVVAAGGWWWGALLVAFFTSSSWLSRHRHYDAGAQTQQRRGSERDWVQVLANGAVATAVAMASQVLPSPVRRYCYPAFGGVIAAVTADTWATEIGAGSRLPRRMITTGHLVPAGTSGGVTTRGTVGDIAGATAIAVLAATGSRCRWAPGRPSRLLLSITVAGVTGSLGDSLLGATLQASYTCSDCGSMTDHAVCQCGQNASLTRGYPAITNDIVNLAASSTGAFVAASLSRALGGYDPVQGESLRSYQRCSLRRLRKTGDADDGLADRSGRSSPSAGTGG
jgi:uncharacterized protein (TIGR00297 family)